MSGNQNKKLRVALLSSSINAVEEWKMEALKKAISNNCIEVIAIIVHPQKKIYSSALIASFLKNKMKRRVNATSFFKGKNVIDVCDVPAIQSLNADIIFCTDENYSPEIEKHATLGVWMFSFLKDNECINIENLVTEKIKNISIALLANRQVIRKGAFRIYRNTWKKTLRRACEEAANWMSYCCKLHSANITLAKGEIISASTQKTISLFTQLKFPVVLFIEILKNWKHYFFIKEVWNVGVISKPISACLLEGFTDNIYWMSEPANGFNADPFGYEFNDSLKIIYEDLNFKPNKGKLSVITFDKASGFSRRKTLMENRQHLSYPYLIEDNGKLFMLPECNASGKISLFEIERAQTKIISEQVLIENIKAVDATIIFYQNKWWLFCTRKDDTPDLKLYIYYSVSLTGDWKPHLRNPVKVDISSAQPGGTPFIIEGMLYRPSQDSSHKYGDRIILNRVEELTETAFNERRVGEISPNNFRTYNKGMHTLSAAGNYTLIDAKRYKVTLNRKPFLKLFRVK